MLLGVNIHIFCCTNTDFDKWMLTWAPLECFTDKLYVCHTTFLNSTKVWIPKPISRVLDERRQNSGSWDSRISYGRLSVFTGPTSCFGQLQIRSTQLKKTSRTFQKAKLEFTTYRQLCTWYLHCSRYYTRLEIILMIQEVVCMWHADTMVF